MGDRGTASIPIFYLLSPISSHAGGVLAMGFFGGGGGAAVDLASPSAIGSTTPNTGAFTTLSFAPANNSTGFSNTGNSLTGSNAQSLISLAQTWNTTGTPTAIKF